MRHDIFDNEVKMYVHEEMIDGKPLTQIINETNENVKYLKGAKFTPNVVADPDIASAVSGASFSPRLRRSGAPPMLRDVPAPPMSIPTNLWPLIEPPKDSKNSQASSLPLPFASKLVSGKRGKEERSGSEGGWEGV